MGFNQIIYLSVENWKCKIFHPRFSLRLEIFGTRIVANKVKVAFSIPYTESAPRSLDCFYLFNGQGSWERKLILSFQHIFPLLLPFFKSPVWFGKDLNSFRKCSFSEMLTHIRKIKTKQNWRMFFNFLKTLLKHCYPYAYLLWRKFVQAPREFGLVTNLKKKESDEFAIWLFV